MYLLPFRRNQTQWQASQTWKNTSTSVMAPAPSPRSKPSAVSCQGAEKAGPCAAQKQMHMDDLSTLEDPKFISHRLPDPGVLQCRDWAGWGSCSSFCSHAQWGASSCWEGTAAPVQEGTGTKQPDGSQECAGFTQLFSSPFCKCFWQVPQARRLKTQWSLQGIISAEQREAGNPKAQPQVRSQLLVPNHG